MKKNSISPNLYAKVLERGHRLPGSVAKGLANIRFGKVSPTATEAFSKVRQWTGNRGNLTKYLLRDRNKMQYYKNIVPTTIGGGIDKSSEAYKNFARYRDRLLDMSSTAKQFAA